MNFEKISFRTTEKERQLLERLNKRYRSRTVTSFMHRLFQELEEKQLEDNKPASQKIPDVFGDINFGLTSIKEQAKPEKLEPLEVKPSAQQESDPFMRYLEMNRMAAANEEKQEHRPDIFQQLIQDFDNLAKLKDAMLRASPYIRNVHTS